MDQFFEEIKRFFKKYIKQILIASVLLTTVFSTLYLFKSEATPEDDEYSGALTDPDLYDGNAYFKFYVEDENQEAFTNTVLLNQYLRLEENLTEVSENTNTNLLEAYEEQKINLELNPTDTIPVIEVRRDNKSQLMTLYVRLENIKDNKKIANYLFDELLNNKISVLENKDVYLFLEPNVFEKTIEKATTKDLFSSLNIRKTIMIVSILLVLSIVLMISIFLGKEFFSKKLNFSFSYFTDESTEFNLYSDRIENNYEISKFLSAPGFTEKLLVTQNILPKLEEISKNTTINKSKNKLVIDTTKFYIYKELENTEELSQVSEIIIVVEAGKTDRNWFNTQKRVASLYNKPIKVLQINR
ncbi:hypothetical protein SAMN02745249_01344 [Atopostipes suicloacalis DSM 15692]|uniref:Uncharacterized protein n=1 Tax=Atopostipes suicloacalis DSM 15692 TaxID=1121025 RepID=A0A1M4X2W8_9LACT|nr:hypothetical protein [Atopostipes suicloacalis]SHE87747.1 hypothetical protein SAMN02745249_01344 [Atopostipes suicloacalis DSM 15692]